jgi:sodium/bile acid cotransporter 7
MKPYFCFFKKSIIEVNMKFLAKYGIDGFILSLIGAIVLAYLYPQLGAVTLDKVLGFATTYGVSMTFFLYGLKLDTKQLLVGISNWKLHTLIQTSTFIFFPVLALLVKPWFDSIGQPVLWLAIFYLGALPSTVSSSVVMVSLSCGNVVSAIFNATLSSLLGIVLTPLWMSLFMGQVNSNFDLTDVLMKLVLQVIVPVIIGMSLNKLGGAWAQKNKVALKMVDQTVIILIVYQSFCDSFDHHIFATLPISNIIWLSVGMIVLFQVVYQLIKWCAHRLGFNEADTSTAIFCGSKKSLVHGTVMSKVLFGAGAEVGIYLLPIMIYHAGQLIGASYLARKRGEKMAQQASH